MSPKLFIFLAIVGCIGLGIVAGEIGPPSTATAAKPDIKPTPEALAFAALIIRSQGFFCPEATHIFPKGLSARGPFLKVHCGPAGSNQTYTGFAYRFTTRGDKDYVVEEW